MLAVALALTTMTTVLAQDRLHFVPFTDNQDYRSQHPTALAVDAEADAFMQRVEPLLKEAVPEQDPPVGDFRVWYGIDPVTTGTLTRFTGTLRSGNRIVSGSEVLFVDTERGTYRRFTLDPTDVEGDVRRIIQYAVEKESELANEALVRANLLDLHGRRLSLHAAAMRSRDAEVQKQRQPYCATSGHVEIRSWEPLGFPVVLTELSTTGIATPWDYNLRRWGRCWAAPEIDVRIFTTHWFVSR